MAGEISISGLANTGFDYQAVLQKYQELKSISIQKLQYDQQTLQSKKNAISQIKDKLNAFVDAINALKDTTTYQTKVANLSNPDIADITVGTDAHETNYSLTVNSLAKASSYKIGTISTITDYNATISSTGSLTINYLKDGTATSFTVDYTGKSLKNIMDTINSSGDLQASIINLGTSSSPDYQLIVSSKNTGTANAITGIDDTSNPGDDSAGVFSEQATNTYETVAAQDAQITLNGINFTSSTNTFSNVITGITINVKSTGSSNLEITKDTSKVQGYVEDILNKYNDLMDTVENLTKQGQPLSGDSTFIRMASKFANLILDNLAQYGFIESGANGKNGRFSLNKTEFDNFMNRSDAPTILQNFANNFDAYLNNYIDTTSSISKNYDRQIDYVNKRIDFISQRINKEIEIMKQQFIKLETYMAEMQDVRARIAGFSKNLGISTGQ